MARRDSKTPWWETLPAHVGGDVIVGNVEAGGRNVAIGKGIQQTITSTLGAPTPSDKQVIEQRFADVATALDQARAQLDATTAAMADFQLKLLKGELTKTGEAEVPSASTITQVGDWLLDNLPQMAESIVGLFATPAVGRVVGKAGETVVSWAKRRFGQSSAAQPTQPG